MPENFEKTRDFELDELVPDGVSKPKTKTTKTNTRSNQTSAPKKRTNTAASNKTGKKKNGKGKRKFKPIYLVPITFVVIVLVIVIWLWSSTRENGPVYGGRCDGLIEFQESVMSSTASEMMTADERITALTIEKDCRQIKINMTVSEATSAEDAAGIAQTVLQTLDTNAGVSHSNSESAYSDLFGVLNADTEDEVTQYHVDFIIQGTGDSFPIFASKHPKSDTIQFTYNSPRDQEVVDEVLQRAEEEASGSSSEDTTTNDTTTDGESTSE